MVNGGKEMKCENKKESTSKMDHIENLLSFIHAKLDREIKDSGEEYRDFMAEIEKLTKKIEELEEKIKQLEAHK